jgi:hypothetical protein
MPIRFAIQNPLFTLTQKTLTFREKQPYLAPKLHPKPHCKATLWGNVVPTPFRRAVKPALSGAKDPSSTVCLHLCSVGIPRSALHLPHFHVGVCGGLSLKSYPLHAQNTPQPCSKCSSFFAKALNQRTRRPPIPALSRTQKEYRFGPSTICPLPLFDTARSLPLQWARLVAWSRSQVVRDAAHETKRPHD